MKLTELRQIIREELKQARRGQFNSSRGIDMIAESETTIQIGDQVQADPEYGGATGEVVEIRGSFVVVQTKAGRESYHESDLTVIATESVAIREQANPELDRTVREFIRRLATKYQYRESDAVMAIFEALKRLNMLNKSVEYMSPSGFGVEK